MIRTTGITDYLYIPCIVYFVLFASIARSEGDDLERMASSIISNYTLSAETGNGLVFLLSVIEKDAPVTSADLRLVRDIPEYRMYTHEKATALHLLVNYQSDKTDRVIVSNLHLYDEITMSYPARDILLTDQEAGSRFEYRLKLLEEYIVDNCSLDGWKGPGVLNAATVLLKYLGREAYQKLLYELKDRITPEAFHMISTEPGI